MKGKCLGCGVEIDYSTGACPECGWNPAEFRERGRHGGADTGNPTPTVAADRRPVPKNSAGFEPPLLRTVWRTAR